MEPVNKVKIEWSPKFAYAIGLISTDGYLSKDKRHINFTSKDLELIKSFRECLGLNNSIGRKSRAQEKEKKYFQVQFGDVVFYRFLQKIGLTTKKSNTLGMVKIPGDFFFDFLRGLFDGDGTFYSYWDPRWKSSYMFYTSFVSASKKHILWLREKLDKLVGISGHVTKSGRRSIYQLKYAKSESLKLLPLIYYDDNVPCLERKRIKIEKALDVVHFCIGRG